MANTQLAKSASPLRGSLLRRLLGGGAVDEAAHALYAALVAQARQPAFYLKGGVADSVDGRFDLIALHCMLVLRRLGADNPAAPAKPEHRALAQRLQEVMFSDLDRALREMGVGDLSVGKKIKQMADAFFGRFLAYGEAMACCEDALAEAIARNVYRGAPPFDDAAAELASYVRRQADHLAGQDDAALARGDIHFLEF